MRGSGNFFRGGGGVQARRSEDSLSNVFLVLNLFFSLQSGSNGFITKKTTCTLFKGSRGGPTFSRGGTTFFLGGGGGFQMLISIETHITRDFPGGVPDPLSPLWIRTCRQLLRMVCCLWIKRMFVYIDEDSEMNLVFYLQVKIRIGVTVRGSLKIFVSGAYLVYSKVEHNAKLPLTC